MRHWLLDSIAEKRHLVLVEADYIRTDPNPMDIDYSSIREVASTLEIAILDLISDRSEENGVKPKLIRQAAADAFKLVHVLPQPEDPLSASIRLLRISALAVLGNCSIDTDRVFSQNEEYQLSLKKGDWGKITWATIIDIWLELVHKGAGIDRDDIFQRLADIREKQGSFEKRYLDGLETIHAKTAALELIGLYHLAKAGEILADFLTDRRVSGTSQVRQSLKTHFDQVLAVCECSPLVELEPLTHLLIAASEEIADHSMAVARSVYSVKKLLNLHKNPTDQKILQSILSFTNKASRSDIEKMSYKARPDKSRPTIIVEFTTSRSSSRVPRESHDDRLFPAIPHHAPTFLIHSDFSSSIKLQSKRHIRSLSNILVRSAEVELKQTRIAIITPHKSHQFKANQRDKQGAVKQFQYQYTAPLSTDVL